MAAAGRLRNVGEACERLGVSRPTVYRLIRDGQLAVVKLRGRTLFRPEDLDALITRSVKGRS